MRFTVSGKTAGGWEFLHAETATDAAKLAEELHTQGAMPVHIKRDGILITSTADFDRMLLIEKYEGFEASVLLFDGAQKNAAWKGIIPTPTLQEALLCVKEDDGRQGPYSITVHTTDGDVTLSEEELTVLFSAD